MFLSRACYCIYHHTLFLYYVSYYNTATVSHCIIPPTYSVHCPPELQNRTSHLLPAIFCTAKFLKSMTTYGSGIAAMAVLEVLDIICLSTLLYHMLYM